MIKQSQYKINCLVELINLRNEQHEIKERFNLFLENNFGIIRPLNKLICVVDNIEYITDEDYEFEYNHILCEIDWSIQYTSNMVHILKENPQML